MTMYKNKFVACLKAAGKILREKKDSDSNVVSYVPFGSEYSLLIKNLNTVRANVKIEIDGQDALDGTCLVVQPNSEIDIERFIKNGNFNQGNRFKFIERNAKVEQGRGIGAVDGLIRIEFQFEKAPSETVDIIHHHKTIVEKEYVPYPVYPKPWKYPDPYWYGGPYYNYSCVKLGSSNNMTGIVRSRSMSDMTWNANDSSGISSTGVVNNTGTQQIGTLTPTTTATASSASVTSSYTLNNAVPPAVNMMNGDAMPQINDVGITVAGSISEQKFQAAAWFPLEDQKHVIVLKLLGETGGKVVQQPVTVKLKQKCSTCGHVNKATHKCCSDCGTHLELV